MLERIRSFLGVLVVLIVCLAACTDRQFMATKADESKRLLEEPDRPVTGDGDPCWYRDAKIFDASSDAKKEQWLERQQEMRFGFKVPTALADAISLLNSEMKCHPLRRDQAPLTEEEVIAAIVAGVNQNSRSTVHTKERDVFWQIAAKRELPKGTILDARVGANMSGSPLAPNGFVRTTGIEVFLQINADKNGRDELPVQPEPQEYLVIRKLFSKVTIEP